MGKIIEQRSIKTITSMGSKAMFYGAPITSEIATNSKNAICIEGDNAVIYTSVGEPIYIRKWDLADFILEVTWGYYDGRYARTSVEIPTLRRLCEKFKLDIEAFGNVSVQKKTIYIHKLIMGFYDVDKRNEILLTHKQLMDEYGLSSIDEMEVDHDTNNCLLYGKVAFNFSDQMRLVPKSLHRKAWKIDKSQRHTQDIYPISRDIETGVFQLEIRKKPSSLGEVIGVITDTDKAAASNIKGIQEEMQKWRSANDKKLKAFHANKALSNYEKWEYGDQLNQELLNDLIDLGKSLEQQGKVQIKWYS